MKRTLEYPTCRIELDCETIPEEVTSCHSYGSCHSKIRTDIVNEAYQEFLENLSDGLSSGDAEKTTVTIENGYLYCYPSKSLVEDWKELVDKLGYENEADQLELLKNLDQNDLFWKASKVKSTLEKLLEEQEKEKE